MQNRLVALLAGGAFLAPILGAMVLAQPDVRDARDALRFEMAAMVGDWLGRHGHDDGRAQAYAEALAARHEAAAERDAAREEVRVAVRVARIEDERIEHSRVEALAREHAREIARAEREAARAELREAQIARAEAMRELAEARAQLARERTVIIRDMARARAVQVELKLEGIPDVDVERLERELEALENLPGFDDDCADLDGAGDERARYWRMPAGDGALRYRPTPL